MIDTNPFIKLEKGSSLSEQVEQQILNAIQQKIYLPGDKLPGEMKLAENFGVSRTAIREAIGRLIGRGSVEKNKGSSVYVSSAGYSSVTYPLFQLLLIKCGNSSLLQIAGVRKILEPEFSRMAAMNRTDEDIAFLEVCYKNMEINEDKPGIMTEYDIQFHRRIAICTQNILVPVIMEPIYMLLKTFISDTYTQLRSPGLALKNHALLLTHFKSCNGEGAYQTMKQHMKEAEQHAVNFLADKKQT